MDKYFNKFPTMYYNNVLCRDITRRVTLEPGIRNNIDLYYPVEIQAGFRSDSLAEAYYEDAELDWMVYLSNKTVDPYYGWYLSELNFNEHILNKYGTIEEAQEKIKFYRNNWYDYPEEITPSFYENTIDKSWRKYYEPIFGPKDKVIGYKRKAEDWMVNTNRILQYTISLSNSAVTFANSEIVDIKTGGEIVGSGEVVVSNNSTLIIFNVSGNTSANSSATKTIIGETSGANGTANSVTILQENFTNSESVFWSAVSYYDWEFEKNEELKNINVIDAELVLDISETVREKLNVN